MPSLRAIAPLTVAAVLASTTAPAAAVEHVVTMLGMDYAPATLVANAGDVIRFINDDSEDHVVFVPTNGFATDLGTVKPGEARTMPVLKTGTFEVECVIHPSMLMTVTVTP